MDVATITAVIPTYRRPAMLRRAIESVLGQTYPHIRVAVFDNASGDETASVVAELAARDSRVRYRCHPENLGAVRNFQAGMDAVDTDYFCLLSDDDLLLPGFFAHAMDRLRRQPGAGFFCGQTVRFNPDEGTHEARPTRDWQDGFYEAGQATFTMLRTMFTWTGVVFSTRIRELAGPFERIEICDLLFMGLAAARSPFVVSLVPCAVRTYWTGSALRHLTPDQIGRVYEVTAARLTGLASLPSGQADRIGSLLEAKLRRALGTRLRNGFLAGDRQAVERAGRLLEMHGGLGPGQRVRLALATSAGGDGLLLGGVRGLMRMQQALRRRRRVPRHKATLEDVVRLYSASLPS